MADKIKRYDFYQYESDMELSDGGHYMTFTDHQAAMREAFWLLRRATDHFETNQHSMECEAEIDAFLSAHQECGGGGE